MFGPVNKKIVLSRDVIFDENQSWDWSKNQQEEEQFELEWDDNISQTESEEEQIVEPNVHSPLEVNVESNRAARESRI